jgi:WD40 repeat protein
MTRSQLVTLIVFGVLLLMLSVVLAQESNNLLAYEVRWSPDGHWIGVGSLDGGWIFDAQDSKTEPFHYFEGSDVYVVTFDPMRPYAAVAPGDDHQVRVLDIESGEEVYSASAPMGDGEFFSVFYDLGYSDDGRLLSVVNTSWLYVFDAETGENLHTFSDPEPGEEFTGNWLTALDHGNDVGSVLVTDWNGRLLEYDVDNQEGPTEHHLDFGYAMGRFEAIPGSSRVVFHADGSLYTYDLETETLKSLDLQVEQQVFGSDLSPDGELLGVGAETAWYLYDLVGNEIIRAFESDFDLSEDTPRIYSLAFSPDGDRVATLQTDGQLKIWDVTSGEVIAELGDFTRGVSQRWG